MDLAKNAIDEVWALRGALAEATRSPRKPGAEFDAAPAGDLCADLAGFTKRLAPFAPGVDGAAFATNRSGKYAAFVAGGQLYVAGPECAPRSSTSAVMPVMSPTSALVAMKTLGPGVPDGASELQVTDLAHDRKTPVIPGVREPDRIAFAPDGAALYFTAEPISDAENATDSAGHRRRCFNGVAVRALGAPRSLACDVSGYSLAPDGRGAVLVTTDAKGRQELSEVLLPSGEPVRAVSLDDRPTIGALLGPAGVFVASASSGPAYLVRVVDFPTGRQRTAVSIFLPRVWFGPRAAHRAAPMGASSSPPSRSTTCPPPRADRRYDDGRSSESPPIASRGTPRAAGTPLLRATATRSRSSSNSFCRRASSSSLIDSSASSLLRAWVLARISSSSFRCSAWASRFCVFWMRNFTIKNVTTVVPVADDELPGLGKMEERAGDAPEHDE